MNSAIQNLEAIDVHGHYGEYANASHPLANQFRSADLQTVARRALEANSAITVVSPIEALTPRGHNDPIRANQHAALHVPEYSTLRFWVVIDPRREETFAQAEQLLQSTHCIGIKIHPEEHLYCIRDYGTRLFQFAQKHSAPILTHSGEQNSLPEDYVAFCNDFPEVILILAHLGCGYDGDPTHQVRAIQKAKSNNVYVDTSSAQSLMPHLIEWGVKEIGAEQILFGTDAPLYSMGMQRTRINEAEICDNEKRLILRENALRIFPLG